MWTQPYTYIELTHNHGTENVGSAESCCSCSASSSFAVLPTFFNFQDADFHYDSGNNEPKRGFGHVAVFTDDVYKACEELEAKGVSRWRGRPHQA